MAQGLTNPSGGSGSGGTATTVRAVASSATDTPIRGTGAANQTGDYLQLQDSTGANKWRVAASGRSVEPLVASVTPTYDSSGRLTQMVYKDAAGVTVLTSTLTYSGTNTNPATQTDAGDGRTDAYTLTWNSDGTLASRTATRTNS